MGRAVLAPGARAFLQEGAIPLEGGLVRGRVRHAAEELETELPELLEALQQGSTPCTESCDRCPQTLHYIPNVSPSCRAEDFVISLQEAHHLAPAILLNEPSWSVVLLSGVSR